MELVDDFSRGARDSDLQALLARPEVSLTELNLRERRALATLTGSFDVVFHFAAILGVANVLERPAQVLRDNVTLVANTLDWASSLEQPPRFLFTSTSEVYAGTLEAGLLPVPTPEDVPIVVPPRERPRTSYMLSKLYGEALCLASGLPVTIVRPHNFFGPRMGMAHVIPELLSRAHAASDGGRLCVYSVDHTRTFCYVDDAVELLLRAATLPQCEGQTLNLGSESPEHTIRAVAELVIDTVGKRLEIEPLPPTPGSPPRRAPSIEAAAALTGYRPRVELEDGIRRTYAWYREHALTPV